MMNLECDGTITSTGGDPVRPCPGEIFTGGNQEIEPCQPNYSAIIVVGIRECAFSTSRIAGSRSRTSDDLGCLTYFGGPAVLIAFAIVSLASPSRLAISHCDSP